MSIRLQVRTPRNRCARHMTDQTQLRLVTGAAVVTWLSAGFCVADGGWLAVAALVLAVISTTLAAALWSLEVR